jgi:hypothetical protein
MNAEDPCEREGREGPPDTRPYLSIPYWSAPSDAPAHICLLVVVSHPQDRAGVGLDPVGDRHWAQRNLQSAAVAPGAPAVLPFTVANPFDREGAFLLVVGPVDRRRAARLASAVGTEPGDLPATVRLLDADGEPVGEGGREDRTPLGLGSREARRFQVVVEVGADLPPGQSVGLEAFLLDASAERVVGALGIALLAPGA